MPGGSFWGRTRDGNQEHGQDTDDRCRTQAGTSGSQKLSRRCSASAEEGVWRPPQARAENTFFRYERMLGDLTAQALEDLPLP